MKTFFFHLDIVTAQMLFSGLLGLLAAIGAQRVRQQRSRKLAPRKVRVTRDYPTHRRR